MANRVVQSTKLILLVTTVIAGAKLFRIRSAYPNKDDGSDWDLSSWSLQSIEDLRESTIEMIEMKRQGFHIKTSSTPVRFFTYIQEPEEIGESSRMVDEVVESSGGHNTRTRLLRRKDSPRRKRTQKQQREMDFKDQSNKWDKDAEDMEGEMIQYFRGMGGEHKTTQNTAVGGGTQSYLEVNGNAEKEVVRRRDQQSVEYTWDNPFSPDCTDPDSGELRCPPEDLPQKCDKYNGGTMEECYQMCKDSFCCIHDSLSKELAPSCSQALNCKNWGPCYIVWWKLHDTIGTFNFVGVEQDDAFFNINFQYILEDSTIDYGYAVSDFYNQLFMHHFDDDFGRTDSDVEDPNIW